MDTIFFQTEAEFREWLEQQHAQMQELWVGFYKKSTAKPGISYGQAVDQALCFGWIDGIRKTIDVESYMIRFTPRKPRSIWSAVNLKRAGELVELGLMHASGLKTYQERDPDKAQLYSYENDKRALVDSYEAQFRENPAAWDFFQAQPPYYKKVASFWVMSAKKEETRLKRLATLIEDSAQGRRLAQVTYQAAKNATSENGEDSR
ncbi:MAG: YdeI/OmpD-associated family protein [Chloroflexi bacterium]|uniref:YdeI/OmpD-associated family protein n=1 Tax=Candidatus Chlorohelix allophototropha TaxID=3003348 RepID=A0A8T7M1L4_9CHLR|nr:YdeI/OmpD-associated family protein [Chloroflexota bacterium]WJW67899.1 YdeI/OmpD-associated family protein [Chloroflexota bacterium L227-S17]